MKFLPKSSYSKCQKIQLLVQLLHSHTFEQDQDLEKFIFNYRQKAGLRKQLSYNLRTFLSKSFWANDLEIFATLEVLRSFVEKLYEQSSDTGLDYPNREMNIVCYYSLKFPSRKGPKILTMFGGPLVIVDTLLAVHRFGDNHRNGDKIANLQRISYRSLSWLLTAIDVESETSLTRFLLSSKPFISTTTALLHRHVQTAHVHSSGELLGNIRQLFSRFLTYAPFPEEMIVERSEIVEPMLRASMGLSFDDHYDILADLMPSLANCLALVVGCRNQLCSVNGWANFLLSLLERLIEQKSVMKKVKLFFSSYNNDHFIIDVVSLLTILLNRLSPDEKGRFVGMYSTPKVCQVLVAALDNSLYRQIPCLIVGDLIESRLFVEQLKECGMIPALRKYRSSIKDLLDNVEELERIDNILSALVRPSETA